MAKFMKNIKQMKTIVDAMASGVNEIEKLTLALQMQANWLEFQKQQDENLKNERHSFDEVRALIVLDGERLLPYNEQEWNVVMSVYDQAATNDSISGKQWKLLNDIVATVTARSKK